MSPVDAAAYARKRAEERAQSSWFKLKEGDNRFRILPTPPGKGHKLNWIEYSVHRDVGPKKTIVRCGVDPGLGDGQCWLCDVKILELKRKKMDTRADALAPRSVLLMQVAKVNDNDKMAGPFLFTPSKQVGDQLLASIFGSKKRDYINAEKGFNISISRTGTGRNDTRYGVIEPDQEPSVVDKKVLDKLKSFSELKEIPVYSKAKQQAAYTGQDIAEEEDESEGEPEEAPVRRSTRRPVAEEEETADAEAESEDADESAEDEDFEDTADDAVEEEEEAPAPRTKPKVRARAPEPEPEEEEGEEEITEEDDDIPDDDIDDEDAPLEEDEEEIAEEEEEAPPPRPKSRPAAKPAAKPVAKPAARPVAKPAGVKPKPKVRR